MRTLIYTHIATAAVFIFLTACAEEPPAPSPALSPTGLEERATSIRLDQPLHFTGSEGNDVIVPAGQYDVQRAGTTQLRLVPAGGSGAVTIAASPIANEPQISAPVAVTLPVDNTQHVVLFEPGGGMLDAVGTTSGVVTRGPISSIPQGMLAVALSAKVSKVTPSPLGNPSGAKLRIPVNLTIQPAPQVSNFQNCAAAQSGGYVNSVVAKWVIMGQPYKGTQNAPPDPAGPSQEIPSGSPYGRMNPGALQQYHCAIGQVTVIPTGGSLQAGDVVQLRVISDVYGEGALVQDRYQLPAHNGPLIFPDVIVAGAYVGMSSDFLAQKPYVDAAVLNMSTGELIGIEALLNGASLAKLPCLYKANVKGGGAGIITCPPNLQYPQEPPPGK